MIETNSQLKQEILASLGLDVGKIAHHQQKIHQVLRGEKSIEISIKDVCSLENLGVVSWDTLLFLVKNLSSYVLFQSTTESERHAWIENFIVTCIPAAGAAARYWNGVPSDFLASYAHFPKALLPATLEGDTFLDIKILEQKSLLPTRANALIVPCGFHEKFQQAISSRSETSETTQTEWSIFEQTKTLSTIRFHTDGSPYFTEDNLYSPVPAGHGELLYLFSDILKRFPFARGFHLRNIDNIIGTKSERAQELFLLAESFYLISSALNVIRSQVKKFIQNIASVFEKNEVYLSAVRFLNDFFPTLLPNMSCVSHEEWEIVLQTVNKPLSVFGVVKKEVGDAGGGPVFAQMPNGKIVKICLEMSHANEADRLEYFGENGKLLYFNPVLVFFETQTEDGETTNFNELFDDNFWLLSKRQYLDSHVYYHETVLYELIGNSEKTNLVFIEVPRTLFKPHKYFMDSIGKTRKAYEL